MREPHISPARLDALCDGARRWGVEPWVHERTPHAPDRPEGLHLTAAGAPTAGRPFGRSCHGRAELDRAFAAGARYALLSPVFRPTSKPDDDRAPIGIARFVAWAAGRSVFALGGLTPARAADLTEAGAHGVAVLGAIFGEADPASAAKMVTRFVAACAGRT